MPAPAKRTAVPGSSAAAPWFDGLWPALEAKARMREPYFRTISREGDSRYRCNAWRKRLLTDAYKLRADADYSNKDLTEQGHALRAQMRPVLALRAGLVEERAGTRCRGGTAMVDRRTPC
jgi:hypothetical protein